LSPFGQSHGLSGLCGDGSKGQKITQREAFIGRDIAVWRLDGWRRPPTDIPLPRVRHDFRAFQRQAIAERSSWFADTIMPAVKQHACTILGEFERAQTELVGKAVILTDGKAGTVESVWLDEIHDLRITIRGHDGNWPVSTIKFAQTA
jgi:hypothetical protein